MIINNFVLANEIMVVFGIMLEITSQVDYGARFLKITQKYNEGAIKNVV